MSNNFLKRLCDIYFTTGKEAKSPRQLAGIPTSTYGMSSLVYRPAKACVMQVINEMMAAPKLNEAKVFFVLQPEYITYNARGGPVNEMDAPVTPEANPQKIARTLLSL